MKTSQLMNMLFAGVLCVSAAHAKPQGKPNIIFLLTDDQRWDTLGCMGNRAIKTPNIDRMASQGIAFDNSFVTTSICVTSRASILRGQYMRTHGVRNFVQPVDAEWMEQTYPALLRKAGYATAMVGKFGIGADKPEQLEEAKRFFDYWKVFTGEVSGQGKYFPEGRNGPHVTDILTGQACEFIEQSVAADKPFCLSVSYKAPHGPWKEYNPRYEHTYDGVEMPVPETFTQEAFDNLPESVQRSRAALTCGAAARESRWGAKQNPQFHQEVVKQYYRLITGVDDSVGAIRKKLAELGIADNTIIIYTGDNGHFIHDYGLYGKWLMYEESMRVPLVVYDPRTPKKLRGSHLPEMMLNIDHAPTMLALCGVPIPGTMQGADYSALLHGKPAEWRKDFFYEHTYGQYPGDIPKTAGVRTGRFAYMRLFSEPGSPEQLFDLRSDRQELDDLAGNPEYTEVLGKLRRRCDEWRKKLPDNNPDYDEYDDEYLVLDTNRFQDHDKPMDLAASKSVGQTFRAETGFLQNVEIRLPTWGQVGVPGKLVMKLFQDGKPLGTKTFDGKDFYNQVVVRADFAVPVREGGTLYLEMSTPGTRRNCMAAWAYNRDVYPGGAAYVDGSPKNFDLELRAVFRK